jgi:transposase
LSAQKNKTDRNDARGIAQIVRTGWYQPVHIKSVWAQEMRVLLTNRRMLSNQRQAIDNELRGILRNFGLKIGKVGRGRGKFEARVRELLSQAPSLEAMVVPMLTVRAVLVAEFARLHRMLLSVVRSDATCQRMMTMPSVGPVTSLSYVSGVDDPGRFQSSQSVGAHFGMTPRRYQSGEKDYTGRISKCGDELVRTALYEAATVLLTRVKKPSSLRDWGLRVARNRGMGKAKIAVARRMAVVLHRMWVDGTMFEANPIPHDRPLPLAA